MRCQYCHNPEIVLCGRGTYSTEQLFNFLEKRQGKLDGVVFTGGEATLHPQLISLAEKVQHLGFKIKLDTNGLRPQVVQTLITQGLVDYIALDYKAPPEKFKTITGVDKYHQFSKTLDILCLQKNVPFEVRTTVHTGLLDAQDIQWIMDDLQKRHFKGDYYVQNYKHVPSLGHLADQITPLALEQLVYPTSFPVQLRNY